MELSAQKRRRDEILHTQIPDRDGFIYVVSRWLNKVRMGRPELV